MFRRKAVVLACVILIGGIYMAGCRRGAAPRVEPPKLDPAAAAAAAMAEYDTNKDGKLSPEEMRRCPALWASREHLDPNNQGLTREMLERHMRKWVDSAAGSITQLVRVTRRGQPLEGATVTFEPEKFLGPSYESGSGTTDKDGVAGNITTPSAKAVNAPGLPPGFYKIKITKPGDNIPARYNEKTELGAEVSYQAMGVSAGLNFDLDY